jgi:hypothetical protein
MWCLTAASSAPAVLTSTNNLEILAVDQTAQHIIVLIRGLRSLYGVLVAKQYRYGQYLYINGLIRPLRDMQRMPECPDIRLRFYAGKAGDRAPPIVSSRQAV